MYVYICNIRLLHEREKIHAICINARIKVKTSVRNSCVSTLQLKRYVYGLCLRGTKNNKKVK